MVPVARKNLLAEKTRFVVAVGGVAFAVFLVVVVMAVYLDASKSFTAVIDDTPADIWVTQDGAFDMFHSRSSLPEELERTVADVPGVTSVHRVLARQMEFGTSSGEERSFFMAVHADEGTVVSDMPGLGLAPGQVVVSNLASRQAGIDVGDLLGKLAPHTGRRGVGLGKQVQGSLQARERALQQHEVGAHVVGEGVDQVIRRVGCYGGLHRAALPQRERKVRVAPCRTPVSVAPGRHGPALRACHAPPVQAAVVKAGTTPTHRSRAASTRDTRGGTPRPINNSFGVLPRPALTPCPSPATGEGSYRWTCANLPGRGDRRRG